MIKKIELVEQLISKKDTSEFASTMQKLKNMKKGDSFLVDPSIISMTMYSRFRIIERLPGNAFIKFSLKRVRIFSKHEPEKAYITYRCYRIR